MRAVLRLAAAVLAAVLVLCVPASRAHAAPACPSSVGAPQAIAIEVSTGDVACARDANARRPIGSTTKLMTALLTLENIKLSKTCTASSYRPAPIESQIGLDPGERMKAADLMRGLLVESGNDAAMALAKCVSGSTSAFVHLMNKRAKQLGLTNTHYENPIGLDSDNNYSSAHDLVTLAEVLRTNSFFKKVTDSPVITLKTGDHPRTFTNRNLLVRRYGFVNGVKTGHTQGAGYVLVGSASRNGIQLITAVLGTPSEDARDNDTMALFRYAFPRFERIRAVIDGRTMATVPIRFRSGATLKLKATHTIRRIVRRGHRSEVQVAVDAPRSVAGPIRLGQRLGSVKVTQNKQVVATVPLVAASAIPAASIPQRSKNFATSPLFLIGAALALGGTVLALRRRALRGRRRPREASAA